MRAMSKRAGRDSGSGSSLLRRRFITGPESGTRSGAAAVEFALVLPVFLLLLAGMMETGQAFMQKHVLANAARRGARLAVMQGTLTPQVEELVRSHCSRTLGVAEDAISVRVSVYGQSGGLISNLALAEKGDACEVVVSVPYSLSGISFYSSFLKSATLYASCTMEHE